MYNHVRQRLLAGLPATNVSAVARNLDSVLFPPSLARAAVLACYESLLQHTELQQFMIAADVRLPPPASASRQPAAVVIDLARTLQDAETVLLTGYAKLFSLTKYDTRKLQELWLHEESPLRLGAAVIGLAYAIDYYRT